MKVGAGQHEGATGMVVRVEDPISILLDDATREELRVFTRDLSESGETATGLDRRAHAWPACMRTPPAWAAAQTSDTCSLHLHLHPTRRLRCH